MFNMSPLKHCKASRTSAAQLLHCNGAAPRWTHVVYVAELDVQDMAMSQDRRQAA